MRTEQKFRCGALLAAGCPLLSGCGMAVLTPQGPVGNREATLIAVSTLLMLIVVLPVIFMTLYFAWRYREGAPHDDYAPRWSYSRSIDILVWTVPLLIVICLAAANWRSTLRLDPYKPLAGDAPVLVVDVVALDWKWLFIYPQQGVASINEVVIPTGTQVDFRITSDSAMNVFFIPQLGTQIYAMSGMMTQVHLLAKNAGRYRGLSANFSGPGFPDMRFTTIATSDAGFAAWVKKAQAAQAVLDDRTFQFLAGPRSNVPVGYFGHVKPGMFEDIVNAHSSTAKRLPEEDTE